MKDPFSGSMFVWQSVEQSVEIAAQDALMAFNELVKTEVPLAVTKSLGGDRCQGKAVRA